MQPQACVSSSGKCEHTTGYLNAIEVLTGVMHNFDDIQTANKRVGQRPPKCAPSFQLRLPALILAKKCALLRIEYPYRFEVISIPRVARSVDQCGT